MKRTVAKIVAGVVAILLIWVGAAFAVRLVAMFVPVERAEYYANLGDLFSTSAALFGGLGFLGVAVVLAFDVRERRRDLRDREQARRPYLKSTVAQDDLVLGRAKWEGPHFALSVTAKLALVNITAEPALNIEIISSLSARSASVAANVEMDGLPLEGSGSIDASVRFDASGAEALALGRALQQGEAILLDVTIRYASLNGTYWRSRVQYVFECDRSSDRQILESVLDRSQDKYIDSSESVGGGDGGIAPTVRAVVGSWVQEAE